MSCLQKVPHQQRQPQTESKNMEKMDTAILMSAKIDPSTKTVKKKR